MGGGSTMVKVAPFDVHPTPILAELAKKVSSPQTALFPGNGDRVGFWLMPPEVFAPLQAEFKFQYDACPFPRPGGFDGLEAEWGSPAWCNPPFTGMTAWARKCLEENQKGKTTVMICPIDKWHAELLAAGAEVRPLAPFRWMDPAGRLQPKPGGRTQALFILRGRNP